MKRLLAFLLVFVLAFSCCACSPSDETDAPDDEKEVEDTTKPVDDEEDTEETEEEEESTESSHLVATYKVPLREIYIDVPDFKQIEAGYTEMFLDGMNKYVGFTCIKSDTAADAQEAHDKAFENFRLNVHPHHVINDDYTEIRSEKVTVNGIETIKHEGKIGVGIDSDYYSFIYGYSFEFAGYPCAVIGVVIGEEQPQDQIDLVKEIIDEMMQTVRDTM